MSYICALIFIIIAFFISLGLTFGLVNLLSILGLVDKPGGRHIHTEATPKGGGIAFILTFFVVGVVYNFAKIGSPNGVMDLSFLGNIALPVILLTFIGYLDDRHDIRALVKLMGHIAVGVFTWLLGIQLTSVFGITLHPIISLIFTVFWIVAFINAFNLIDGMDGLAGGLAIVASVTLAIMFFMKGDMLNSIMILLLAASIGGFLWFNFYPARIFMGDMGSMFLGYFFAVIGIIASNKIATTTAVFIPIVVLGVPFFDMFLAVWRRSMKKILNNQEKISNHDNIMSADCEHLHHRIFSTSKNQGKAVFIIYMIALVFSLMAFTIFLLDNASMALILVLILIAVYITMRDFMTIELHLSSKVIFRGISKPARSTMVGLSHPFFDLAVLGFVYWIIDSIYVARENFILSSSSLNHASINLIIVFIVFISLVVFGIYRRFWLRASPEDYMRLISALVFGHIIAMLFLYFILDSVDYWAYLKRLIIFGTLVSFIIFIERFFLRTAYFKLHNLYINTQNHLELTNVILYGAGIQCQYLLQEFAARTEEDPTRVLGIIDDLPGMWGKIVYGNKVLGNIKVLERLAKKNKIDKVIITTRSIKPENLECARKLCSKLGIKLVQWKYMEETVE